MVERPKRPADLNLLAKSIVDGATGNAPPALPLKQQKNPAAVELGRLGGLKGGKARAAKLTAEQRREGDRKAALARWKGPKPD